MSVSVAQLIGHLAVDLKDPGWIPGEEEFFFTWISFKEEMRQMEKNKNNNSSNA